MTMPGFNADIRDLAELATIDGNQSLDSFENTLDLIAILNHSFNNKKAEKDKE
jgi:hypothetical protein